jgi:hypothetical protein
MPIPEILTVQSQPLLHVMQPFQGRHKNKASSMPGSIPESNSMRFKRSCVVLTRGSEPRLRRLAAGEPRPDKRGQGQLHDSKRQKLDRVKVERKTVAPIKWQGHFIGQIDGSSSGGYCIAVFWGALSAEVSKS